MRQKPVRQPNRCPKCQHVIPYYAEACHYCSWTPWYRKNENWFFIIAVTVGVIFMTLVILKQSEQNDRTGKDDKKASYRSVPYPLSERIVLAAR